MSEQRAAMIHISLGIAKHPVGLFTRHDHTRKENLSQSLLCERLVVYRLVSIAAAIAAATAITASAPIAIATTARSLAAARLGLVHLAGLLDRQAFQHCAPAQADLAACVDIGHHHHHFIAELHHRLDGGGAIISQLADVHHAVGAGQNLDERAEVGNAHDFASVNLADLHAVGQ